MRKQAEKDKLTALSERLSYDDERAGNVATVCPIKIFVIAAGMIGI